MRLDQLKRPRNLVLALALVLVIAWPFIARNPYFIGITTLIAIYGIATIGLGILMGSCGQASFAQGAFMGIGAYVTALLTTRAGVNFVPALAIGAAFSGVIGFMVGLTSVRLGHFYLAMATMAFHFIFFNVASRWVNVTGGEIGITVSSPNIFGLVINTETEYYYLAGLLLLAVFLFSRNIMRSKFGRNMVSIKTDPVAAAVSGIPVVRMKLAVFCLSSVFAGIAGGLLAPYMSYLSPRPFSPDVSVILFLSVLVGGAGKVWGSLLGAAFFIVIPEIFRFTARIPGLPQASLKIVNDYTFQLLLYSIALFFVVAYLPDGIMGLLGRSRKKDKRTLVTSAGSLES